MLPPHALGGVPGPNTVCGPPPGILGGPLRFDGACLSGRGQGVESLWMRLCVVPPPAMHFCTVWVH